MGAFASIVDYEELYGVPNDKKRCVTLIDHASAFITAEMKRGGAAIDTEDETQALNLARITCRVVHDLLDVSDDFMTGVSQMSETQGSFSQSWSFANPSGKMFLYKDEKRTLGINSGRVSTISPWE